MAAHKHSFIKLSGETDELNDRTVHNVYCYCNVCNRLYWVHVNHGKFELTYTQTEVKRGK